MRWLVACLLGAATFGAQAVEIEGDRTLPPCDPFKSLTYDCHITDWNMAINMMTNPPSRERQPNAYYEYLQYERERDRNGQSRDGN